MFSFFQRKNIVSDIEWLGTDVHSHLLPGIDDGATDMTQSTLYIQSLKELGFKKLICTPHIFKDVYENSAETIFPVLDRVKSTLLQSNINIEIDAAAEYMADGTFTATEGLLTLPGNYILIEMSYLSETPNIDQIIFDLQIKGYKVILAHPERYKFYHRNKERYQRFKDMGCFLQLNLLSVLGYYGKDVKLMADHLIKSDLYDFAGTDLHHGRHLEKLTSAVRSGELFKILGHIEFKNKEMLATVQHI